MLRSNHDLIDLALAALIFILNKFPVLCQRMTSFCLHPHGSLKVVMCLVDEGCILRIATRNPCKRMRIRNIDDETDICMKEENM